MLCGDGQRKEADVEKLARPDALVTLVTRRVYIGRFLRKHTRSLQPPPRRRHAYAVHAIQPILKAVACKIIRV